MRLRLAEAAAQVGRPKAQRELAASQLARLSKLVPGSAVAQTALDEARAQLATVERDLAATEARRRGIEHDIAEAEIRVPFAGDVTERFAQRGEYLQIGSAVVHLVGTGRLEARVQAPLALESRMRAGQELDVRLNGVTRPTMVRAVVPVGDPHLLVR